MTDTPMVAQSAQSLSKQLTRRVLLLSLIGVVGLGSAIVLSLSITLQHVQTQMDEINIAAARAFDLFFLHIESDLLSTGDALTTYDNVGLVLLQLRARNPSLLDVFLVDFDGTVLAQRNAVGRARQTHSDQQLWLDSPPPFGKVYIGPVRFEEQAPFVDMAATATDDIGLPSGLLLVRVDLTQLWNTTLNVQVGKTGYAYIADDTGQLVAYRNRRFLETGSNLINLVGRTPQTIAERRLSLYAGLGDQLVLASAQPLQVVPWFAVVEQPAVEAITPLLTSTILLLLALVIGGVVLYDIIRFTRVRIVSPLLALSRIVGQMAGGQLNQRIPVAYPDELGHLASSFNSMSSQLQKAFDALEDRIAEQKRTREKLQQSEEHYREIFENAGEGIFQSTPDGRFLGVNPAMARIFGYASPAEMITAVGNDIGRHVYVDPRRRVEFTRILEENGVIREFEAQNYHQDGSIIWTRTNARAVRDANGALLYYEGFLEDITDHVQIEAVRQQAEKALRQSNEFLQSILQNTPSSIFVRDLEGRYLLVNREYERIIGRTLDQVVGKHPEELHQPQAAAQISRNDGVVLANGMPLTLEEVILVDDEPHTFIVTEMPLRDAAGNPYALCTVATDITERVRSEAERMRLLQYVQAQARQMQQILDAVPESVVLLDAEQRVLLANPAAREALTLLSTASVGDRLDDLGTCQISDLLAESTRTAWHEIEIKDRTYEAIGRSIRTTPESTGWVLVIRDMTEAREMQQRMRQQDRMAVIGQLAGGVAHDFNNILTAIQGYTELVLSTVRNGDPIRADLEQVLMAAQRAAALTRQLLAFSRKQVMKPEIVDLNQIITNMEGMLRRLIGEEIALRTRLSPSIEPVLADSSQIEQVVLNLIVNARDAVVAGHVN
ncbi:MAG: PAS domain S-box protein [Anaerolineae bacterium]|nr:PAS domain S-box protein [Anaerolineae bacterium]